ncbi:ROK family protein [Gudongella sp. DL1XJH-153]|uniref:ROK family protein n=1 Tax=Gudongella sp. DL1XJH-153 TaxID=3409804 RepID=UPI003BB799A4
MKRVIGIDLGGTKVNGAVVDESGEILKWDTLSTSKSGSPEEVMDGIKELVHMLSEGENISAIGIGSPGFIDSVNGKVLSVGGNIEGWAGTEIKSPLEKEFKIPVQVENDANAAGLCEAWIGAGRDLESFVMLTVGTGLGGALFTRREGIWRGHHFQAGEVGHSILYPGGHQCSCGQRGCTEEYVSGTAVENEYERLSGIRKSGKEIFDTCKSDDIARKVVARFAWDFAVFLLTIKNMFDPQAVIIGGGVILSKDHWWDEMIGNFQSEVNNDPGITILPALYLNDSGTIGAARAALDRIEEVD